MAPKTLTTWQLAKIKGGSPREDNTFLVLTELPNGEERGLLLDKEQLENLSSLLLAQWANQSGKVISFECPENWNYDLPVEMVTGNQIVWPGTLHFELSSKDGRTVNLTIPHEEAVRWRDRLSSLIDAFLKTRAN